MRLIPWTLHSGSKQFIYNCKMEKEPGPGSRKLEAAHRNGQKETGTKIYIEKGIYVVLRRYANKSRVKATRREVVLRWHANKSCAEAVRKRKSC